MHPAGGLEPDRMPSRHPAALLVLVIAAGVAAPAAAEEALLRTEKHVSELAPDSRPTHFSPWHSVRAEAFPTSVLELFGETQGFRLDAWRAVFELEGGAALRLLDHTRITASYRLLSSDEVAPTHGPGLRLSQHLAAPYLGIALDF
jgi:hypothetical protein